LCLVVCGMDRPHQPVHTQRRTSTHPSSQPAIHPASQPGTKQGSAAKRRTVLSSCVRSADSLRVTTHPHTPTHTDAHPHTHTHTSMAAIGSTSAPPTHTHSPDDGTKCLFSLSVPLQFAQAVADQKGGGMGEAHTCPPQSWANTAARQTMAYQASIHPSIHPSTKRPCDRHTLHRPSLPLCLRGVSVTAGCCCVMSYALDTAL